VLSAWGYRKISVDLGEIATGIIPSWMVMARVDSSQGLGTRSSPGKDILTSVSVVPHLQYHGLSTGLNTKLPAITAAPKPSSMMDKLNLLSGIV
jgi:hypothetical protein